MNTIEEYYKKYYFLFVSYVHKYIGDYQVSEDIVQDLFMKFIEKKVDITNPDTALSFFFTSLRNMARDVLRSKQFQMQPCDVAILDDLEEVELSDNFYEDCEKIYMCGAVISTIHVVIDDFEEMMSNIVVNKYFHNVPNAAIARCFDISRYHVDKALVQASADFKEKLKSLIFENFSDFFQQFGQLTPYTL